MPASSLRRSPSIRECSSEGFVTREVAQTDRGGSATLPEAMKPEFIVLAHRLAAYHVRDPPSLEVLIRCKC